MDRRDHRDRLEFPMLRHGDGEGPEIREPWCPRRGALGLLQVLERVGPSFQMAEVFRFPALHRSANGNRSPQCSSKNRGSGAQSTLSGDPGTAGCQVQLAGTPAPLSPIRGRLQRFVSVISNCRQWSEN